MTSWVAIRFSRKTMHLTYCTAVIGMM